MLITTIFLGALIPLSSSLSPGDYDPKYGTYVGKLKELHHDVTGDVWAVDKITIYIRKFNYDGEAPDAFFFAGNNTPEPSNRGFIIPDERGKKEVLGPYRNRNMVITFPVTKKGQRSFLDIKWISVWCRKFAIDFGHVTLPKNLIVPDAVEEKGLHSEELGLNSSKIILHDTNTIELKDFTYDAKLDDTIFVMGSGDARSEGFQVPDEKGSLDSLKKYSKKSLKLNIPKEAQGKPIQYFALWSPTKGILASATFKPDIRIPPAQNSLK